MKKVLLLVFLSYSQILIGQDFDCDRKWETVYLETSILECPENEECRICDDFDDNYFDLDVWRDKYPGLHPNSPFTRLANQCSETIYLLENLVEEDGLLKIKHRYHEDGISWTNQYGDEFHRDFSSGTFEGNSGINFGRIEGSFKMPQRGWMPAFWLWHHNEIDLFERFTYIDRIQIRSQSTDIDDVKGPDCNEVFDVIDDMISDEFKYFAVEWTPFKLRYYYKDKDIPIAETYRFYDYKGEPLDINCGETIPQGYYKLNPNYPQIIYRYFTPGMNVPVAPRHAYQCCGNNEFCGEGECTVEGGCNTNKSWNPLDAEESSLNSETQIDYINAIDKDYNQCGSLAIHNLNSSCYDREGSILIEDWGGQGSGHMVKKLSVKASENIEFEIEEMIVNYIIYDDEAGFFEIAYQDDCGVDQTMIYDLAPKSEIDESSFDLEIFECGYLAEVTFKDTTPCALSIFDHFTIRAETNKGIIELETVKSNGKVKMFFDGEYSVSGLEIDIHIEGEVTTLRYPIVMCDLDKFGYQITPNPFQTNVVITSSEPRRNVNITILNYSGQTVFSQHFDEFEQQDFELDLVSGFYFVRIEHAKDEKVFKLVKM